MLLVLLLVVHTCVYNAGLHVLHAHLELESCCCYCKSEAASDKKVVHGVSLQEINISAGQGALDTNMTVSMLEQCSALCAV